MALNAKNQTLKCTKYMRVVEILLVLIWIEGCVGGGL